MELFYREKGNPSLPPLIILHGLWGASDNWLTVASHLAGLFHVILPDFRNHGHSPHSPEHNYEVLSQNIRKFITRLQLPVRPFIAGHSMGGMALMTLLLKQPQIAAKAAIIDSCPYTSAGQSPIHARLLSFILDNPAENFKNREELTSLIRQAFPEDEYNQLLLKNIRKTHTGYEWKINATALQKNLSALMNQTLPAPVKPYPAPLLFVRAANSGYIPTQLPTALCSLFPYATLTTIPRSSHRIHADQPLLLAQTLSAFFLPH